MVVLVHDVPEPPELDVEELLDGVQRAVAGDPRRSGRSWWPTPDQTTDRGQRSRRRRWVSRPSSPRMAATRRVTYPRTRSARASEPDNGLVALEVAADGLVRIAGDGSVIEDADGSSMAATSGTATTTARRRRTRSSRRPDVVGRGRRGAGPIRGAVEVVRSYRWPARRRAGRRGADGVHRRDRRRDHRSSSARANHSSG